MNRLDSAILTTILALVLACGDTAKPVGPFPDEPAPTLAPATLTIALTTAGRDVDPDGYQLAINATAPVGVAANGTLHLSDVAAGTYHVVINEVARWCDVAGGGDHAIGVGPTGAFHLEIQVNCRTTFRDWLLYDGAGEIRLFDLTGDPAQAARLGYSRISCDGFCTSAAVRPDGGQVAWVAYNGLMVMNANRSARRLLVAGTGLTFSAPAWSPDGARIAYVDDKAGSWDLYVVALDGSAPQLITSGAFDPAWSPDGNSIVFSRRVDPVPTSELWLVDPHGGNLRPLGTVGTRQVHPSWSPDGESIVYGSDFNSSNLRMRVIAVDGTNDRPVGPEFGYFPDWSRDGQQIAFTAFDETGCRTWLATMAPDGSNVVALGPFGEACELVEPPMPQTNHAEWGY